VTLAMLTWGTVAKTETADRVLNHKPCGSEVDAVAPVAIAPTTSLDDDVLLTSSCLAGDVRRWPRAAMQRLLDLLRLTMKKSLVWLRHSLVVDKTGG